MRAGALLVAGMIGLTCCVISLIDARGADEAEIVRAREGIPHLMRGWVRTPPKALWLPAE